MGYRSRLAKFIAGSEDPVTVVAKAAKIIARDGWSSADFEAALGKPSAKDTGSPFITDSVLEAAKKLSPGQLDMIVETVWS